MTTGSWDKWDNEMQKHTEWASIYSHPLFCCKFSHYIPNQGFSAVVMLWNILLELFLSKQWGTASLLLKRQTVKHVWDSLFKKAQSFVNRGGGITSFVVLIQQIHQSFKVIQFCLSLYLRVVFRSLTPWGNLIWGHCGGKTLAEKALTNAFFFGGGDEMKDYRLVNRWDILQK